MEVELICGRSRTDHQRVGSDSDRHGCKARTQKVSAPVLHEIGAFSNMLFENSCRNSVGKWEPSPDCPVPAHKTNTRHVSV